MHQRTQDSYRNSHRSPRPIGPAACPRPRWTPVMRLAPYLFVLSLIGCGGPAMNAPGHEGSSPFTVSSPDLPGGTFPHAFTCDGANRLPRLEWSAPPAGTRELAIEMLDPDAPGGTFTHWLVYGLPPGLSSLTAVPAGAAEGVNDFGRLGYGGPCPPRTTTTSWSLRWTPGWVWRPERHGPIWNHAPAVTCSAGANWSPPTSAPDRPLPRQARGMERSAGSVTSSPLPGPRWLPDPKADGRAGGGVQSRDQGPVSAPRDSRAAGASLPGTRVAGFPALAQVRQGIGTCLKPGAAAGEVRRDATGKQHGTDSGREHQRPDG
jgi:hypothetical protein